MSTGKTIHARYNYQDLSSSSFYKYAQKIGADYKFISREIPISPFYGIFLPFTENWCDDYDAVCFIDSDILATKKAQNIFNNASNDKISIHKMKNAKPKKDISSLKVYNNGILNSGVVVFPRSVYRDFKSYISGLKDMHENISEHENAIGGFDQALMNKYLIEQGNPYFDLHLNYNYNLSRNSFSDRWDNFFIHYHRRFKNHIKKDFKNVRILKTHVN